METQTLISIIIVTYKSTGYLKNCVFSVREKLFSFPHEIIIINNDTDKNDFSFLDKKEKIFRMKKNIGFGPAINYGVKQATGKYLFFLNPDSIIIDDGFQKIIEIFQNNPGIGVVGLKLVNENNQAEIWNAGENITLFSFVKNNLSARPNSNILSASNLKKVGWVSGAALLIRKDIFEKISGFDENFFMYFEDVDLCLRACKSGFKTVVCPAANVVHFSGQSPLSDKGRKTRYYEAQDYFFRKYYGSAGFYLMRFLRFFYSLALNQ